MKRLGLVPVLLVLVAVVPSFALAKGASEATITGPGLGNGIDLAGEGQPNGQQLMQLAEEAGFFQVVYGSEPNVLGTVAPRGDLGPRYRITYVMPGPDGTPDELRQDLYPYASAGPVTFMEPGQSYYGAEQTVGGWYTASPALKEDLVAIGLPRTPPVDGGGSPFPWTLAGAVTGVALALALATLAVLRARRSEPVHA